MQNLQGLDADVFAGFSHVVIGKVLIEKDWSGNFEELPDVLNFRVNTTVRNMLQRLCAISFSLTALNTYDRFALHDEGAAYYGWIRQGRRIKIYAGIQESETEYYWQWITGLIDDIKFSESNGEEIVEISGRDYMRVLAETNLKNEWWGTQKLFDSVEGQEEYDMPSNCNGIYRAWLDVDAKDGSNFVEIVEGNAWTYNWESQKFMFLDTSIPAYDGYDNLLMFYFTDQVVEEVIADILIYANILKQWERKEWLENTELVVPTGKTLERVWFKKSQNCLEAIRLLIETVLYRFWFDEEGNAMLRPKPLETDPPVLQMGREDVTVISKGEDIDEVYNQILVYGEERLQMIKLLTVSTEGSEGVAEYSFTAKGSIESIGSANATKRGFELGVERKEKDYNWEQEGSFGVGDFCHVFTSLVPDKQYYFRAWAVNEQGKFHGNWQSVTTSST